MLVIAIRVIYILMEVSRISLDLVQLGRHGLRVSLLHLALYKHLLLDWILERMILHLFKFVLQGLPL